MLEWITRYKSERMIKLWSDEEKYKIWKEIEVAVLDGWAKLGVVPYEAVEELKKVQIKPEEVKNEEIKTRHEVTAFVKVLENKIPKKYAKFVHLGITSSDIMDTAFSIQIKRACRIIREGTQAVEKVLLDLAEKYKNLQAVGRTHGIQAEPMPFGLKFLSHYAEFRRVTRKLILAEEEVSYGKISGAVGIYNTIPPEIEEYVLSKLGLNPEPIATQVVPRDRYAFFILVLSLLASAIERMALNLRLYQISEIDEVREPFGEGQTGSSIMPHKKNPVLSENLCGIARVIRSTATVALENIALFMERDISHSSAERITFPQVCILSDFALMRLKLLLEGLFINEEKIKENFENSKGLILSSKILLELVLQGMDREEAYKIIQEASFQVIDKKFPDLKTAIYSILQKQDRKLAENIKSKFEEFTYSPYIKNIYERVSTPIVELKVRKKREVFDPEGKAIADRLRKLGYDVKDVRVGKTYKVYTKADYESFKDIFFNPLIEEVSIQLEG